MTAIRSQRRIEPGHADPDIQRSDGARPSSRSSQSPPDWHRVPDAPHYSAFLAGIAPRGRTEAETRARLDSFRDSFGGPYLVDGEPVSARPMFRMNGGANDPSQRAHERELIAICTRNRIPLRSIRNAIVGRPTPSELRRVTQALVDAGKLPASAESLERRIRTMQWEWGIGVDCAGYTEQAARAARGEPARAPTHGDAFTGLRTDRTMRRIEIDGIRAGDVIHLDPPSPDDVGHNVVVYAHRAATKDECARALGTTSDPDVASFLRGQGPFHLLEVDSSWGAGPYGDDYGGFRRDTWTYDESSSSWLFFERSTNDFRTSTVGPHGEPYSGAFRPQSER